MQPRPQAIVLASESSFLLRTCGLSLRSLTIQEIQTISNPQQVLKSAFDLERLSKKPNLYVLKRGLRALFFYVPTFSPGRCCPVLSIDP